jgi:hypothetical protein
LASAMTMILGTIIISTPIATAAQPLTTIHKRNVTIELEPDQHRSPQRAW